MQARQEGDENQVDEGRVAGNSETVYNLSSMIPKTGEIMTGTHRGLASCVSLF